MICNKCGHELAVGDWPFCKGNPPDHGSVFNLDAQRFDPIVIHRDASGNVRFPGAADAPVPPGFTKVELRTSREVFAFEREYNHRQRVEHDVVSERIARQSEDWRKGLRAELRDRMRHMSEFGKDFARAAMEANDRRPRERFEPGFHVEIMHYDSGSRDAHRDERTGWRGRKS